MSTVKSNTWSIATLGAVAALAFSTVSAAADDTPSAIVNQIKSVAPEVSVSSLSHAEIASIMNVITSSEGNSEAKALVTTLAEKYEEN
tara:strand:- start:15 stop:278 length:264 start_codon:yes stop_codon:yes gene_type:complete